MNGFVFEKFKCNSVTDPFLGSNKNNWVAQMN